MRLRHRRRLIRGGTAAEPGNKEGALMNAGRTVLLILSALAVTVFTMRIVRILRAINTGRGEYSFDKAGVRFKNLLVNGFCQKTVLKKLSGLGHVIIFWGFFFLVLDALEDMIS